MIPNQNPAHEGRFREAILKAERDVASSRLVTATAGLLTRPGTSARGRVAFAPDPAAMPGMEGRETGRHATVERREVGLPVAPGGAHASQAWRRALPARHSKAVRLSAFRHSLSRGWPRRRGKKKGKRTRRKECAGREEDCAV